MRGGARVGAGRKRKEVDDHRTNRCFTIDPVTILLIERLKEEGYDIGQEYDRHIAKIVEYDKHIRRSEEPFERKFYRRKTESVTFTCRISPETRAAMKEYKGKINFSRELDNAVERLYARHMRLVHK